MSDMSFSADKVHDDGSMELSCMTCGELLLAYPGDDIHIVVDDDACIGVLCTRCFDTRTDSKGMILY